ncbi:tetratricopeptide repeat protein [Marinobacterium sp. D7]|uniref:YfgM family protein n=1 Tax=Marinobacterium ramblicola TaxID=2849041 RepID=UPI001C2D0F21|nr:tetratricopeptide repeat protein [Marinobacterium ramblicola]
MAELRTEEEQIEAIKNWWKENGRSLLLAIVVALAAVLGWQGWQKRQAAQATNASITYQELVDAVLALRSAPDVDAQRATAEHLAGTLKSDYSDSGYAVLASLLMAKVNVDNGAFDKALDDLGWVQQNAEQDELKQLALQRIARIRLAQGDAEGARDLLKSGDAGYFTAAYEELLGDVLVALGDEAEARKAYEKALAAAAPQAQAVLQMKRDDLAQGDES